MVKQIIKEAMDRNPIGLKEALEEELKARVALALEAKMGDEDDEDDDDEMDEAANPKWKVKIGNKTYVVTAKNTFEANKKAEAAAKKEGNSGVSTGKIEKV